MQLIVDGAPAYYVSSPSGEVLGPGEIIRDRRPNLGDFDSGQAKGLTLWLPCATGFLDALEIHLAEYDDFLKFDDDQLRGLVPPLRATEAGPTQEAIDVREVGGDGHYRLLFGRGRSGSGMDLPAARPSADGETLVCQ